MKGVSGYEIQYSTSKKFTKKTTKQMKVKHTNKWIRLKGKKKDIMPEFVHTRLLMAKNITVSGAKEQF